MTIADPASEGTGGTDPVTDLPVDLLTLDPGTVVGEADFTGADDLCRERIERTTWSGGEAVVKRAEGGRRGSLQREATVLEALAGDGVVTFLGFHRHERHDELWTTDAGRASLADPWSAPPGVRAAGFARACAALGRLHANGWFHGAVTLDHVVLDQIGTARWCSLGSAGRISEDPDGERIDRIAITRAAHRLARALPRARSLRRRVQRLGDEADPRRLARIFRRWSRHHEQRPLARTQHLLASVSGRVVLPTERHEFRGPPVTRTALVDLVRRTTTRFDTARASAQRFGTWLLVGALATIAVAAWTLRPTSPVPDRPGTPPAIIDAAQDAAGNDTSGPTDVRAGPDDRPTAELDGQRVTAGRPGDRILVTDTDCDGTEDALLHRPATGEVFEFDVAGAPATAVPGRLVHRDPETDQLLPAVPCGPPVARRTDGSSTPVVRP